MSTPPKLRGAMISAAKRHSSFIGSTVSVRTTASEIVLTFDDGPSPPTTERIAETLAEFGATATFFVLMSRAALHSASLDALRAQGHEIALHGLDHRPLTGRSFRSITRELRRAKQDLEDLIEAPVRWFRPPYGAQGARAWLAIKEAGMEPVMWNRSARDSMEMADETRFKSATEGASAGDVLLAHDGFATLLDGVDDGPPPTLDRPAVLASILAEYSRRGLSGRSLGDALQRGQVTRRAWFSTAF